MKTKAELPECAVATTVSLIGSKWKLLIIRNLLVRPWRFNELHKSLDGISQKVLTESLRIYCDAKHQMYFGPKKSLKWMQTHDPEAFHAYSDALFRLEYAALERWVCCLEALVKA